ncbi:MAG: MaoC family dehydratase [Alphaproteobacteria bacterium]|nr:MAG: MaoC family dehydratase [Alphaproteobacteria bacterium]
MEEKHGYFLEDLSVGMTSLFAKTITDADIVMFAGISGDTNPVHLDAHFADQTAFKGRIAHGLLSASFISTVLGTRLPGPGCIYLSQTLRFRAPVKSGDTVTARVTVKEIDDKRKRVTLETVCLVDETVVVDGEAVLMVNRRTEVLDAAAAKGNGRAKDAVSGGPTATN